MTPQLPQLPLEELAAAGDELTWSMDDWDWDPISMLALPKEAGDGEGYATYKSASMAEEEAVQAASSAGSRADRTAASSLSAVSSCQADGCRADISKLSSYHQRCRICEEHLKADDFLRNNRPKRFCQQCGRSHELTAFDPKRRSCRVQLAKHAARRRKRSASTPSSSKTMKLEAGGSSIRPLAYKPHHFVSRLSLKLFNCTPADLPDDLRAQLTGWLKSAPAGAEGYMRPGCVHLTLDFLLDSPEQRSIESLVQHLVSRRGNSHPVQSAHPGNCEGPATGCDLFQAKSWMAQLQDNVVFVHQGRIAKQWNVSNEDLSQEHQGSAQGFPVITCVLPSAMVVAGSAQPTVIELQGFNVGCSGLSVLCRSAGRYLPVTLTSGQSACCRSFTQHRDFSLQSLRIQLPANLPAGIAYLEVQKGAFTSAAIPVLVADRALAASEVPQLLEAAAAADDGAASRAGLITDLALMTAAHSQRLSGISVESTTCARADQPSAAHYRRPSEAASATMMASARSAAALHALLSGSRELGIIWQADAGGPAGVTPLHLAALLQDRAACTHVLLGSNARMHAAWTSCQAADGQTPADFARQAGGCHRLQAPAAPLPQAWPGARSDDISCQQGCSDEVPCKQGCSDDEPCKQGSQGCRPEATQQIAREGALPWRPSTHKRPAGDITAQGMQLPLIKDAFILQIWHLDAQLLLSDKQRCLSMATNETMAPRPKVDEAAGSPEPSMMHLASQTSSQEHPAWASMDAAVDQPCQPLRRLRRRLQAASSQMDMANGCPSEWDAHRSMSSLEPPMDSLPSLTESSAPAIAHSGVEPESRNEGQGRVAPQHGMTLQGQHSSDQDAHQYRQARSGQQQQDSLSTIVSAWDHARQNIDTLTSAQVPDGTHQAPRSPSASEQLRSRILPSLEHRLQPHGPDPAADYLAGLDPVSRDMARLGSSASPSDWDARLMGPPEDRMLRPYAPVADAGGRAGQSRPLGSRDHIAGLETESEQLAPGDALSSLRRARAMMAQADALSSETGAASLSFHARLSESRALVSHIRSSLGEQIEEPFQALLAHHQSLEALSALRARLMLPSFGAFRQRDPLLQARAERSMELALRAAEDPQGAADQTEPSSSDLEVLDRSDYFADEICTVCWKNGTEIAYLPCRHLAICGSCQRIYGASKPCVLCRKAVNEYRFVPAANSQSNTAAAGSEATQLPAPE
ncbi:hypothetical protein WJX84_012180 [Apatococcus fuscideae]|uniref:Uncharacterized protein n=1 Tax=Apatococcus fuscideae TaxID=2026836 RepID=A0AAW1T152_9CHLO